MKTTRLVSLIAASLITAAQWTLLFWFLAPARLEAAPAASAALDETMPGIRPNSRPDDFSPAGVR